MNLEPLAMATPMIQIHVAGAVLALALGTAILGLPKGTPRHRRMGRIWWLLMMVVTLSSFFIHEIRLVGPWSPIHLLSVFTLVMLILAVKWVRQGRRRAHGITMVNLFLFALVGTGIFTLLPGRLMHTVVFGG